VKDAGGPNAGSNTLAYVVLMTLLPIGSYIAYEWLNRNVYADSIAGASSSMLDTHRVSYITFQRAALLYAEFLYIPVILLWFRCFTCGPNGQPVYIEQNWTCYGTPHIIVIILVTIVSGTVMVTFPYVIYKRMKKIIVFHEPAVHERVSNEEEEEEELVQSRL
jgi:hypothetical protein